MYIDSALICAFHRTLELSTITYTPTYLSMRDNRLILLLGVTSAWSANAQSVVECENYCLNYERHLVASNRVAQWVDGVAINVKAPGSAMSPAILEYMCDDDQTLSCLLQPCGGSYLAGDTVKWPLLLSWATVCNTKAMSGDDYAIACWESEIAQYCNFIPPPS